MHKTLPEMPLAFLFPPPNLGEVDPSIARGEECVCSVSAPCFHEGDTRGTRRGHEGDTKGVQTKVGNHVEPREKIGGKKQRNLNTR